MGGKSCVKVLIFEKNVPKREHSQGGFRWLRFQQGKRL